MLAAIALALLAVQASAAEYTLYHRYVSSGAEFVPRGTVSFDNGAAVFSPSSESPLSSSSDDSAWYQVALGVGSDLITASTRSCFADSGVLTLHLTDDRPSGIEFKPSDSAACASSADAVLPSSVIQVNIKTAQKVASPSLAAPRVVDTTGQTVVPEPEKTFMQKYWMYIVAGMLFLATQMSDEPRGQAEGGGDAPAAAK